MRITITKDDIRCRIRASKALLDDNERREAATRVFAILEQTPEFMLADHILMYHSLPESSSTAGAHASTSISPASTGQTSTSSPMTAPRCNSARSTSKNRKATK